MSQHPVCARCPNWRQRNVLKRFERTELLKKRGQWKDGDVSRVSARRSRKCSKWRMTKREWRISIRNSQFAFDIELALQKIPGRGRRGFAARGGTVHSGRANCRQWQDYPPARTKVDPAHDNVTADGKPVSHPAKTLRGVAQAGWLRLFPRG